MPASESTTLLQCVIHTTCFPFSLFWFFFPFLLFSICCCRFLRLAMSTQSRHTIKFAIAHLHHFNFHRFLTVKASPAQTIHRTSSFCRPTQTPAWPTRRIQFRAALLWHLQWVESFSEMLFRDLRWRNIWKCVCLALSVSLSNQTLCSVLSRSASVLPTDSSSPGIGTNGFVETLSLLMRGRLLHVCQQGGLNSPSYRTTTTQNLKDTLHLTVTRAHR